MQKVHLLVVVLVVATQWIGAQERPVMSAGDVMALPRPEAQHVIAYGTEQLQFGELRLPDGAGPHPVALVIHGGCWLAEYDLGHISSLAAALGSEGIATWSIEYRRVGNDGGGWPGTFDDVAAAADHLREIAPDHGLDLARVVAVGHSAGGHLALWLAARHRLPSNDSLRGPAPLDLAGVVSLAGIPDLAGFASPEGCGSAVPGLLGGRPADHPERLRRVSPIRMVPSGVPQLLVIGEFDAIVPRSQADDFVAAAGGAGGNVGLKEVAGVGHFELVNPASDAWPTVKAAIREMLRSAGEDDAG